MNLEDIVLSEISTHKKDKTIWFYIYEIRREVKFKEKLIGSGQQLGAEENEASLFNGYRVPVLQDENILEMECITMWTYLILLNCTFQNGYGIFYVYVYFTTIFKTNFNTKETLFHAKILSTPIQLALPYAVLL